MKKMLIGLLTMTVTWSSFAASSTNDLNRVLVIKNKTDNISKIKLECMDDLCETISAEYLEDERLVVANTIYKADLVEAESRRVTSKEREKLFSLKELNKKNGAFETLKFGLTTERLKEVGSDWRHGYEGEAALESLMVPLTLSGDLFVTAATVPVLAMMAGGRIITYPFKSTPEAKKIRKDRRLSRKVLKALGSSNSISVKSRKFYDLVDFLFDY